MMNIKAIIWIIIVIVLLLLVGGGGFFGFQYYMANQVPSAEKIAEMSDDERMVAEQKWLEKVGDSEPVFDALPANTGAMMFLYAGDFVDVGDRKAKGRVHLYRDQDGSYIIRINGLEVKNAPELTLALSQHPLPENYGQASESDLLIVGKLKSHKGDHIYRINANMVSQYGSLVIASPFQSLYGIAGLR